jgi:isoleucyl-tRNA synthetase
MKIIPSSHVTALSGTGLVHCAPAHGEEDYVAFRSLGLLSNTATMLCHVDENGAFSPEIANVVGEEAAAGLVGKDVLVTGNAAMLELLRNERRVVKTEKIRHRYPYDWKTNKPVIMTYDLILVVLLFSKFIFLSFNRATSQWFANLDGIKEDALSALKTVSFYPVLCKFPCSSRPSNSLNNFFYEKLIIDFNHSFIRAPSGVFRGSVFGESQFLLYITSRQAKLS